METSEIMDNEYGPDFFKEIDDCLTAVDNLLSKLKAGSVDIHTLNHIKETSFSPNEPPANENKIVEVHFNKKPLF